MNPIQNWREMLAKEMMAGGHPTHCVMGWLDHATFCGALTIMFFPPGKEEVYAVPKNVEFEGITILESRSSKQGIMFG